ncbi:substrate-binding domain-containing protein [Nonomuraea sp. NPDC050022]|uniref:substrate-binding domain-containing protein n=1 Tax=unclassified Nonomuraea TaxID=2593643 RepID=UPI0033D9595E
MSSNQGDDTTREAEGPRLTRRHAVQAAGLLALGAVATVGSRPAMAVSTSTTTRTGVIRLASVRTVQDGGLLPRLLDAFEGQSGQQVQVHTGEDVYAKARAGQADVVLSHFGHKDAQAFITDGLGQWPRMVLFNSIALIVPAGDPAHVAQLADPVKAFRRIAHARAPFIVNGIPELVYLTDNLWQAAGRPDKTGWYRDTGLQQEAAMREAAQQRGYSLWGATPFLVFQQDNHLPLRPVLYSDQLFHRIMATVVVNPVAFPGANVAGALALQEFLLTPAIQVLIRGHRYPGVDQPLFWPAGRNNATEILLPSPSG